MPDHYNWCWSFGLWRFFFFGPSIDKNEQKKNNIRNAFKIFFLNLTENIAWYDICIMAIFFCVWDNLSTCSDCIRSLLSKKKRPKVFFVYRRTSWKNQELHNFNEIKLHNLLAAWWHLERITIHSFSPFVIPFDRNCICVDFQLDETWYLFDFYMGFSPSFVIKKVNSFLVILGKVIWDAVLLCIENNCKAQNALHLLCT